MEFTFSATPPPCGNGAEGLRREVSRQRERDFLAACRRVVGSRPRGAAPLRIDEVAELAAMSPAPRYYVSFDYALRMIYRLRRRGHGGMEGLCDSHRDCWTEIAAKVDEAIAASGGRLSQKDALARVLSAGSASSFFLSPSTARRLYHHARRGRAKR